MARTRRVRKMESKKSVMLVKIVIPFCLITLFASCSPRALKKMYRGKNKSFVFRKTDHLPIIKGDTLEILNSVVLVMNEGDVSLIENKKKNQKVEIDEYGGVTILNYKKGKRHGYWQYINGSKVVTSTRYYKKGKLIFIEQRASPNSSL